MPTFGFSAFLKLLHLNERPQRSEVRRRSVQSSKGYDFHRSFRLRANRLLVENEPLPAIIASLDQVAREPERRSACAALEQLHQWRKENSGGILPFPTVTYESPEATFKVTFGPDFGLRVGGDTVAVHIWNTAKPKLEPRIVRAALSLFVGPYQKADQKPGDLAVLCLRTMRLHRLGESLNYVALGDLFARNIDGIFRSVREEASFPPRSPEDRPKAPPSP